MKGCPVNGSLSANFSIVFYSLILHYIDNETYFAWKGDFDVDANNLIEII
jgi:hypothetical protein